LEFSGGQGGPAVSAGSSTAETTSGGGSASQSSTSTVLWLLPDNLGTTRDVIDNAGAVVNHIAYAAFGAITAIVDAAGQPLSQSATRYLYTQRELDPTTHLNHHRARYYDPTSGRWLSEDPIGFAAADTNLARYVGNSPLNWVDAAGLDGMNPFEFINDASIYSKIDLPSPGAMAAAASRVAASIAQSKFGSTLRQTFAASGNPILVQLSEVPDRIERYTILAKTLREEMEANPRKTCAEQVTIGVLVVLADHTGPLKLSNAASGTEAITLRELSPLERVEQGVVGTVELVGTATTIAGLPGVIRGGAGVGGASRAPRPPLTPTPPVGAVLDDALGIVDDVASARLANPNAPRPAIQSRLPSRVTSELPEGQIRTPAELKQARNFYRRNIDEARCWYEQRTGQQWPVDPATGKPQWAEHPRPLKNGGDPLRIEPGVGPDPNAPHTSVIGPDGLTDQQRWGRMGGRPKKNP
jgi:RHS repeat-associated protein